LAIKIYVMLIAKDTCLLDLSVFYTYYKSWLREKEASYNQFHKGSHMAQHVLYY